MSSVSLSSYKDTNFFLNNKGKMQLFAKYYVLSICDANSDSFRKCIEKQGKILCQFIPMAKDLWVFLAILYK